MYKFKWWPFWYYESTVDEGGGVGPWETDDLERMKRWIKDREALEERQSSKWKDLKDV